jgi:hypothetical protein
MRFEMQLTELHFSEEQRESQTHGRHDGGTRSVRIMAAPVTLPNCAFCVLECSKRCE